MFPPGTSLYPWTGEVVPLQEAEQEAEEELGAGDPRLQYGVLDNGVTYCSTYPLISYVLLTQVGVNWVRYLPPAPPHALPSINMVAHCGSVGQCRQYKPI